MTSQTGLFRRTIYKSAHGTLQIRFIEQKGVMSPIAFDFDEGDIHSGLVQRTRQKP